MRDKNHDRIVYITLYRKSGVETSERKFPHQNNPDPGRKYCRREGEMRARSPVFTADSFFPSVHAKTLNIVISAL